MRVSVIMVSVRYHDTNTPDFGRNEDDCSRKPTKHRDVEVSPWFQK